LRPEWTILVEDLDPYRHLAERWPGTRCCFASLANDRTLATCV
jgi:hypothetical protein